MHESSLIELQPRSDTEYISQSRTVMVTGPEGFVASSSHQGLWIYQARALSKYCWTINGKQPQLSAFSPVTENSSVGYYIVAPKDSKDPDPAQQSIELRLARSVGDGMREEVWLTNHTQISTSINLALDVESDFISPNDDPDKGTQIGKLSSHWRKTGTRHWELVFDYRASHAYKHQRDKGIACLHRGVRLQLTSRDSEPKFRKGKILFRIKLPPRASWSALLEWVAQLDGRDLNHSSGSLSSQKEREARNAKFMTESARLSPPGASTYSTLVVNTLQRSKRDLAALRLFDLDGRNEAGETWIPAAGLPTYVGLFGRDSLVSSWQASLLGSAMMPGTLAELPKTQATKIDDWRDEQPGSFVHELHTDPRAELNFNPHGRYYGGVTASIYYPTVLSTLWHWTGNKNLVRRYITPALKGLEWADKYMLDESGFYRYRTFSRQGEHNQGWKDSDDALVYPDGSQAKKPLGTCEMQAFVYVSKKQLSEVLWWLGETETAARLLHQAEELKKRFNDFFWMEREGYLGMAIDRRGKLVKSIASDPGHCLASGIVETEMAGRIAERMMKPDLFSGWGVRTLSADHPAFNPFSYHRGSVWPVENAVFILALARYGLHEKMHQLARAFFDTAGLFKYQRLPEVFAGHQRDDQHPFPGMYPRANWPQAWSASAPFTVMQALLGIFPYGPLNVLLLDPWLPEWLPEFNVEELRIGNAIVDVRFRRKPDGRTEYEVTRMEGKLHIIRQPSPWSLTAGWGERVRDAIASLLPGKAA